MAHDESDGFNSLFDLEVPEVEASVLGRSVDNCPAHATVIAHFLKSGGYHGTLETIELAVSQVTDAEGVGYASKKDRRVVNPCAAVGDVAESERSAVCYCFLEEDRLLFALTGYGCLEGAEDLICLGYWELGDRNIGTCSVFDGDRWTMFAVAEEGGACVGEIESHVLI
jgi:hypothetical protein